MQINVRYKANSNTYSKKIQNFYSNFVFQICKFYNMIWKFIK